MIGNIKRKHKYGVTVQTYKQYCRQWGDPVEADILKPKFVMYTESSIYLILVYSGPAFRVIGSTVDYYVDFGTALWYLEQD